MSYKEELEKRRTAQDADKERKRSETQARVAEMVSRATELRQHIEAEGHDIGLVVKQQQARINVKHPKSPDTIRIDADIEGYNVATEAPPKPRGMPAPTVVRGSEKRLATLKEIDEYVLEYLERAGAK
jgi:uncharacterized protein (DUF4415 family)